VGLGRPIYGWDWPAHLTVLQLCLCSGVFSRLLVSSNTDARPVCANSRVVWDSLQLIHVFLFNHYKT
jgi:hypothetical protein